MKNEVDVVDIKLTKDIPWEFKEELKIGHIRADYNDGYWNKWFPSNDGQSLVDKYGVNYKEIQMVVNHIMFNLFPTFDTVVDICDGEGFDHEANVFTIYGKCNYWVRFRPVRGDYNMYINVYVKEEF